MKKPNDKTTLPITSSLIKVPLTLSVPINKQAVSFWVDNFTFNTEDLPEIGHDFTVYIPAHSKTFDTESGVSLALAACSHAAFGRLKNVERALHEGERFYAHSIIKTQEDMKQQLSNEALDQLLITIMLMAYYEVRQKHLREIA